MLFKPPQTIHRRDTERERNVRESALKHLLESVLYLCCAYFIFSLRLNIHWTSCVYEMKNKTPFTVISPMGYVAQIKVETPTDWYERTEHWNSFMFAVWTQSETKTEQVSAAVHGIEYHVEFQIYKAPQSHSPLLIVLKSHVAIAKERKMPETNNKKSCLEILMCIRSAVMVHFRYILTVFLLLPIFIIISGRSVATGETSCFSNRSWSGLQS